MSIYYNQNQRLFVLKTSHTEYQMQISKYGHLLHLYYGSLIDDSADYSIQSQDRGFSGNPYEASEDRSYSLDTFPQEYSTFGTGDYRETCLEQIDSDGVNCGRFCYSDHTIYQGKKQLDGLPFVRPDSASTETLEIELIDHATHCRLLLQYSVFFDEDIITRSAKVINDSDLILRFNRILSMCLDFHIPQKYDLITFYGRHCGERQLQRNSLPHGKTRVDSVRGASSLHYNPFVILCDNDCSERYGNCYGFCFVYSGNFMIQAEVDQIDQTRIVAGINSLGFSWSLKPKESFQTPEVILSFSDVGFSRLSLNYHSIINNNLCNEHFIHKDRPIVLNNWEATYFYFDEEKIKKIIDQASDLGIEMFVLDDGWFGERNDDTSSLGDWEANLKKIPGGLRQLASYAKSKGVGFGLWIEPEMISENSNLYKTHKEWCLSVKNRKNTLSRNQMVLDLSRTEVVDYLFDVISRIVNSSELSYLKWDMNRNICEAYNITLGSDRQGEVMHRYILGLYRLLGKINEKYPNVLIESCSGGGGRFDAGMLFYTPQIWCSDNTDAIARLDIQYGTSFCYPLSCISSHISTVPNHQTGRVTPLETRILVASTGSSGYELDPEVLSNDDKTKIKESIKKYKENRSFISQGKYYRLTETDDKNHNVWMIVDEKKNKAQLSYIEMDATANGPEKRIKLFGLDEKKQYRNSLNSLILSGKTLMKLGFILPAEIGEYYCFCIQFEVIENRR